MNFFLSFLISATFALKIVTLSGKTYEIELHENDDIRAIYGKAAEALNQHRYDIDLLFGNEKLSERHLNAIHTDIESECTAVFASYSDFEALKSFSSMEIKYAGDAWKIDDRLYWDDNSRELIFPKRTTGHRYDVSIDLHKDQGRFFLEIDTCGFDLSCKDGSDQSRQISSPSFEHVTIMIDSEEKTAIVILEDSPYPFEENVHFYSDVSGLILRLYDIADLNMQPMHFKWSRAPSSLKTPVTIPSSSQIS
jgi:hypothetical protein